MQVPVWGWIAFTLLVLVLLGIDLFSHRGRIFSSPSIPYRPPWR